ncbi:MAG TPA: hypothetical protein DCR14_06895 [Acidimicrobiaceae bacterium]|nr:hypothetical protein [Acidimicrobiaceae bacterium]
MQHGVGGWQHVELHASVATIGRQLLPTARLGKESLGGGAALRRLLQRAATGDTSLDHRAGIGSGSGLLDQNLRL